MFSPRIDAGNCFKNIFKLVGILDFGYLIRDQNRHTREVTLTVRSTRSDLGKVFMKLIEFSTKKSKAE